MPPTLHYILHFAESVRRWGPLVQLWLFLFERYNKEMVNATKNNKFAMVSMIKHMRNLRWKAIRVKHSASVVAASVNSSTTTQRNSASDSVFGPSTSVPSLIFQSSTFFSFTRGRCETEAGRTNAYENIDADSVNVAINDMETRQENISRLQLEVS